MTANEQNALREKFERTADSSDTVKLLSAGHLITNKPTYSCRHTNCNSVVLLNAHFAGLSCYDLRRGDPTLYLEELIEKMLGIGGIKDAVVVGGDTEHFEMLREILGTRRIPIVEDYCDGFPENGSGLYDDVITRLFEKSIVVIPTTHEVIMYSSISGFKQMAPVTQQ